MVREVKQRSYALPGEESITPPKRKETFTHTPHVGSEDEKESLF